MSIIQSLIKQRGAKLVATGLIGATIVAGASACDALNLRENNTVAVTDVNGEVVTDTKGNIVYETEADNNTTTDDKFEHSALYNQAKQKWIENWSLDIIYDDRKAGFQAKGIPYKFLEQQGVIYYDEDGYAIAKGNEDFMNNLCISASAYIDTNTDDCDIYVLVQYKDDWIDDSTSVHDVSVTTWMLKYTVAEDVYRDWLLLHNDNRARFLLQEIDAAYTPEVISKSSIDYDLLWKLKAFEGRDDFLIINYAHDGPSNYIESIDYDNMTITVNYSPCKEGSKLGDAFNREHAGEIYSYTIHIKDTQAWEECLVGNSVFSPISEEYRNSLTSKQMMPTRDNYIGKYLLGFKVGQFVASATEEQKAAAYLKYNLTPHILGSLHRNDLDGYECGRIKYEDVNTLTKDYMTSKEYSK